MAVGGLLCLGKSLGERDEAEGADKASGSVSQCFTKAELARCVCWEGSGVCMGVCFYGCSMEVCGLSQEQPQGMQGGGGGEERNC